MNRSMIRKVLGDIWTRKGRTALVSISIFIGVLGVVTLITAGDLLVEQLKADIRADELPMVYMYVTIPGDSPANIDNETYLDMLRDLPGVEKVEGQANYPFFWKITDERRFRESRICAFSEPFGDIALEPLRLVAGQYPEAGNRELAIELRMAEDFDLGIGDEVDIRILSSAGEGEELAVERWRIVGTVFHPYNQLPDESMFAAYEDAQYIAGFEGLSTITARHTSFETAEESLDGFVATITDNTPYIVVFNFSEDPDENQSIEITEQYADILAALAIVAMLVSGFLVVNVINNLVVEQKQQIGVMKSLGATRVETFGMYAGIALIYGVLGMVPGVLLGIPAGYKMAVIVGDFANTLIDEFAISPVAIILGVVLGLGVPALAAVVPVVNGTRVTILEAMTDLGISGGYRVGPIARIIKRLPIPINIKQSLSNVNQKKWRLALTVATLTLAITAFMGVSAVFVRINDVLQNFFETFDFEMSIEPTQSQDYDWVRNLLLENIDGIEEVYPGTGIATQLDGYVDPFSDTSQIFVMGVDPAAPLLDFDLKEGDAWENNSTRTGVVLTSEVADQLNKGVGDTVRFAAGGKELEPEIIGIINFPFDVILMQWRELALFAGYTKGAPKPNEYFTTLNVDGYSGALPGDQVTAWGIDVADERLMELVTIVDLVRTLPGESDDISGVMISQTMAERGGYSLGEEMTLSTKTRTAAFTIMAIFAPKPELVDNASVDNPDEIVALVWDALAELEGVSLDGDPVPNIFIIATRDDGLSATEVDRLIEDINELLVNDGITASFFNWVEMIDQASEAVLAIGIILNMASFTMAAVGAIGLLTTLSISVFERQKEIGVMRSVGAGSWTIVTQFLVEGLLVGVIAWIIAAPLSVGLAYLLTNLLPFGEFIEFAYPPIMFSAGLISILAVAAISSIWPSVSAARKTVADVLRYL